MPALPPAGWESSTASTPSTVLSYGALSLNGDDIFRNGFEPLLPDCVRIPFNDFAALEEALYPRTTAAFIAAIG